MKGFKKERKKRVVQEEVDDRQNLDFFIIDNNIQSWIVNFKI